MTVAARTYSPHEHKPVDRLGYEGVDSTTVSFCTAATVGAAPALTNAIFAATGFEFADCRVKDQLRSS